LEPEFAWKDKSQRSAILVTILNSYNLLPKVTDLDNIETTLSWSHFCHWYVLFIYSNSFSDTRDIG